MVISKHINNILRKTLRRTLLNIALAASLSSVAALLHAGGTPNSPKHDSKQVECLINNVYFESRGESKKGMLAVAYVTLNRTKDSRFPKTICGVVKQPHQFSWVKHKPRVEDKETYKEVKQLVKEVISGEHRDPTKGSLYFHATSIKPRWSKKMNCTTKVGNHVFYKPF